MKIPLTAERPREPNTMPDPAIAKAAEYVHRDMMLPRELDDQIAQEAARLRVSPVALIWNILARHFAPATAADEGPITREWLRGLGFEETITGLYLTNGSLYLKTNGKVWACWSWQQDWVEDPCLVVLETRSDLLQLLSVLNIPVPGAAGE